jgi:hypothetical protein
VNNETISSDLSLTFYEQYKIQSGLNTDPWENQRWDKELRRRKHPYTQIPWYTRGGIMCLGGESILTNTDPWTHQRWDHVPRRSKHPYRDPRTHQRWNQKVRRGGVSIRC